jgi:hypothetical protein
VDKRKSLRSDVALAVRLALSVLLMIFMLACHTGTSLTSSTPPVQEIRQQENPYANAEIATGIIPSANNTFGYDILLNGRPLVHQPNMPGLPGNEGFTTLEKAQIVADFVVRKIRNNEMPPAVTIENLHTLGVLK